MKFLTFAEAIELHKKATTPELLESLIQTMLEALKNYEAQPDQTSQLTDLKSQLTAAISDKEFAEQAAEEALERLNTLLEKTPQDVTVTVDKKKYKIHFGVDGLSKEELAKDKTKVAKLIKIKSGALELLEEK